MMRPHMIPDNERGEVDEIGPGMPRDVFLSSELLRRWTIVHEQGSETWLRHAQGAMMQLRWAGDTIAALRTFEGAPAAELERQHAWRWEAPLRRHLEGALTPGAPLEATLEQALGRRHPRLLNLWVRPRADGGQDRAYRAGGLLEVTVDGAGAVRDRRFLEEGEAADRAAEGPSFQVPELVAGVQQARSWGEAWLHAASLGGAAQAARIENGWDPVRYTLLVSTREGLRSVTYTLQDPTRPELRWLGAGSSALLDGVDLVLAASRLEQAGDPAGAAAALDEALKLIPAGEAALSPASLKTHTARRMLEAQPARFTRASLQAERDRLRGQP